MSRRQARVWDVQPEPERSGVIEENTVELSQPSFTVPEVEEERMTTENASTDLYEPMRGERRARVWDDPTLAIVDTDTDVAEQGAPRTRGNNTSSQ